MQSWGNTARGAFRDSAAHPTKSGVIGLVANALGWDYADDPAPLAALEFAVRADRPGEVMTDFHTAGAGDFPLTPGTLFADATLSGNPDVFSYGAPRDVQDGGPFGVKAAWPPKGRAAIITQRAYLADAVFLAALGGDQELVETISRALDAPARALFLGRRNCVPSADLRHSMSALTPAQALAATPRLPRADAGPLSMWADAAPSDDGAVMVADVPVSWAPDDRRFAARHVRRTLVDPPAAPEEAPGMP